MRNINKAMNSAAKPLINAFPVILGVVLLLSTATALIPKSVYASVFSNSFIDPIIGAAIGSLLAGNPVTSYIIGGELLKLNISLIAVTAFLVTWVTVGIIQLPAEIMMLGKRFAITRNILSFVFAIMIAILTVIIMRVFI